MHVTYDSLLFSRLYENSIFHKRKIFPKKEIFPNVFNSTIYITFSFLHLDYLTYFRIVEMINYFEQNIIFCCSILFTIVEIKCFCNLEIG